MLNSSGESRHPCLVPDSRGNAFNFLPLRIMFAVGLSYMAFIMLRYVSFMPTFWSVCWLKSLWSSLTLCDAIDCRLPGSMGFSRQEYFLENFY